LRQTIVVANPFDKKVFAAETDLRKCWALFLELKLSGGNQLSPIIDGYIFLRLVFALDIRLSQRA